MSHKGTEDKEREDYPFTARQRRRLAGNRTSRKQARKKVGKRIVTRRKK